MKRRVVVTGLGAVTPIGTASTVEAALKYGRGVLERHQRRKSGNRRDYQIRHHRI